MDPSVASIVVACIGTIGMLIGLSIKEFRSMAAKNSTEHGATLKKLDKVQDSIEKVGDRLNNHIDWHIKD